MFLLARFSCSGKYYAAIGKDGILRIWDTISGSLQHEYTPDIHLTSPFTELSWISLPAQGSTINNKRRKLSGSDDYSALVIGCRSGDILLFNVPTLNIVAKLTGGHTSCVNNIVWSRETPEFLFSCSNDQYIIQWNISSKSIERKWKSGKVSSIAVSPDCSSLVSAKNEIKWWNVSDQTVVKTFIGHSSDITDLVYSKVSDMDCVLSASSTDRHIHAWLLDNNNGGRQAAITFNIDDYLVELSARSLPNGYITVVACTKTGLLRCYSCTINGNSLKPEKPKLTVQIGAESTNDVEQIPIIGCELVGDTTSYIVYGNDVFLSFEKLSLQSSEKSMFIVRQDPRKKMFASKEQASTKVLATAVSRSVHYVHPESINGSIPNIQEKRTKKRKTSERTTDVPLELRLENLSVNLPSAPNNSAMPTSESLVHLLLQGLSSKDNSILNDVLLNKEDSAIKTTISRLPIEVIVPFSTELISFLRGRTLECEAALKWLKCIMTVHAAHLISNPDIADIFNPVFPIIESKLNVLGPLNRLSGRLDLMVEQIKAGTDGSAKMFQNISTQPRLVYQDEDSEEGDNYNSDNDGKDERMIYEDSDDHWTETSEIEDADQLDQVQDKVDDT